MHRLSGGKNPVVQAFKSKATQVTRKKVPRCVHTVGHAAGGTLLQALCT